MKKEALLSIANRLGIHTTSEYDNKILASCPFASYYHKDRRDAHPSFALFVVEDGNSGYSCFSCGEQGNISMLVKRLEKLRKASYAKLMSDVERAELDIYYNFSEWGERIIEEEKPIEILDDKIYNKVYKQATTYPEAIAYLQTRRISNSTADLLDLRYDEYQKRVVFPVRTPDGGLCGFTGRAISENLDPKVEPKVRDYTGLPKKKIILGSHLWDDKPVILVEGLFAFARLFELGVHNSYNIGAVLGAKLTEEKADIIKQQGTTTYFFFDNDMAGEVGIFGRDGRGGAADMLYNYVPIVIPAYPEGKDDPDDLTEAEVYNMLENTPLYIK